MAPSPRLARLLVAFTLASPALFARTASADVVMPPPTDCPRGQVGVTSHSGPQCMLKAPTDCPNGWHGQLGGACALRPCQNDASCQDGEVCVEHAVCLHPFEDGFYDYGEEEKEKQEHGLLDLPEPQIPMLQSPALLAGPPMPRNPRAKPIIRYDAVNVCSPEVPCAAPNTCQPEKICVPKGSRALAYRGTNVSGMRVARKTATPLTTSNVEPKETVAPERPRRAGGCAGCAVAEEERGYAWIGALAAIALAARRAWRRFA